MANPAITLNASVDALAWLSEHGSGLLARAKAIENLAVERHVAMLERGGNVVGDLHRSAMRDLASLLARKLLRISVGRHACALPCGGGKTTGIVAVLAAAHELGVDVAVTVAVAQVRDLVALRVSMIDAGLPPEKVGLIHGKDPSAVAEHARLSALAGLDASRLLEMATSTGDSDRQIMLVAHNRIRAKRDSILFSQHLGKPRGLVIWDESLLAATGASVALSLLERGRSALDAGQESKHPALTAWLRNGMEQIKVDVGAQRGAARPSVLRLFDNDGYAGAVAEAAALVPTDPIHSIAIDTIQDFLDHAASPLSVALTGAGVAGDGVIHYRVEVSPDIDNVAVLDASYDVRLLGQIGVEDRTTFPMRVFKRFDNLLIRQIITPAGRSTVAGTRERGPTDATKARALKVAALVAQEIKAYGASGSLVYTFKDDDGAGAKRRPFTALTQNLTREGVDLGALRPDGSKLVAVERWGNETGINCYADRRHVVLAGLQRRSHLDIAASYAGERDDLTARPEGFSLRDYLSAETGHCAYQAGNRGNVRQIASVDQIGHSQAGEMVLSIVDSDGSMRTILEPMFPGATWEVVDLHSKSAKVRRAIAEYLFSRPHTEGRIAVSALKKAVRNAIDDEPSSTTWTSAIKDALGEVAGWALVGRSIVPKRDDFDLASLRLGSRGK